MKYNIFLYDVRVTRVSLFTVLSGREFEFKSKRSALHFLHFFQLIYKLPN